MLFGDSQDAARQVLVLSDIGSRISTPVLIYPLSSFMSQLSCGIGVGAANRSRSGPKQRPPQSFAVNVFSAVNDLKNFQTRLGLYILDGHFLDSLHVLALRRQIWTGSR